MDKRIQKTKNAIKTTYMLLLTENSHSKITITELAKRANIDRKTFYLHYSSIDDILFEILEEKLFELDNELNKHHDSLHTLDVYFIMECINNCLIKDLSFYHALSKRSDFAIFTEKIKKILISKTVESLSSTSALSIKELTICCKFFISGIADIYADWFCGNSDYTLEELRKITSNVIYHGIHILS